MKKHQGPGGLCRILSLVQDWIAGARQIVIVISYKEVHAVWPKENRTAQLMFRLAYFEATVQHFSPDTMGTPPPLETFNNNISKLTYGYHLNENY